MNEYIFSQVSGSRLELRLDAECFSDALAIAERTTWHDWREVGGDSSAITLRGLESFDLAALAVVFPFCDGVFRELCHRECDEVTVEGFVNWAVRTADDWEILAGAQSVLYLLKRIEEVLRVEALNA